MKNVTKYGLALAAAIFVVALVIADTYYPTTLCPGKLGKPLQCVAFMVKGEDKEVLERRRMEELRESLRERARREVCAETHTNTEDIERCQQASEHAKGQEK